MGTLNSGRPGATENVFPWSTNHSSPKIFGPSTVTILFSEVPEEKDEREKSAKEEKEEKDEKDEKEEKSEKGEKEEKSEKGEKEEKSEKGEKDEKEEAAEGKGTEKGEATTVTGMSTSFSECVSRIERCHEETLQKEFCEKEKEAEETPETGEAGAKESQKKETESSFEDGGQLHLEV